MVLVDLPSSVIIEVLPVTVHALPPTCFNASVGSVKFSYLMFIFFICVAQAPPNFMLFEFTIRFITLNITDDYVSGMLQFQCHNLICGT